MTTAANNPLSDADANKHPSRRNTALKWGGIFGVMALLVTFMPLVRVVPLAALQQQAKEAAFDADKFVETFWRGDLMAAVLDATDVSELRLALQSDPVSAAERYGHRLGLSGRAAYLVRGEGRIVSVTEDAVGITWDDSNDVAVRIEIGPVFSNALRDGSGRLDVSDFSNTRDFNDISTAINRRVEEQVLPLLQPLPSVGATVRFAGGIEVSDSFNPNDPLVLVPVLIKFP